MPLDFTKFTQTPPYASELLGIYQPLLSWKSKRIISRITIGFQANLDPSVRAKPFEVWDQWFQVLPTDQVVAVEVQHDPKTGRML